MGPDLDMAPCAVPLGIGGRVAEEVSLSEVLDDAVELFAQLGGHGGKIRFAAGHFRQVLEKWFVHACAQPNGKNCRAHFSSQFDDIVNRVSAARACAGVVLVSS